MDANRDTPDRKREACLKELRECLREHRRRCPLGTEQDIIKFVFQGMLGAGHLVASESSAVRGLKSELAGLAPDPAGILYEPLSSLWCRINLRPALAAGMRAEEIAMLMCRSAEKEEKLFTRQDVFDFCMNAANADSERMRTAAGRITAEEWLPSHSDAYREAYRPAYRVLLISVIKADNP